MSNLLLIAAGVAAREQRRRSRGAALRRSQERKRKEEEDRKKASERARYIPAKKSYPECVLEEMNSDEVLRSFFTTLKRNMQLYRREQASEQEESARKTAEIVDKYKVERDRIVQEIKDSGIVCQIGYPITYSLERFEIEKENNYGQTIFDTIARFNGIELTKEILENPDDTTFKDRYEKKKAYNDKLRAKKEEKEKELKRQELLLKIIPFKRWERENKIANIRSELRGFEREFEEEERLRKEMETFDSLTPEQRKLILDYFAVTDCIRKGATEINNEVYEFERKLPPLGQKEVVEEGLERTMREMGMGEEEITDIFMRLDKVAIKRFRDEYSTGRSHYSGEPTRIVIESFIKNIYEEDPEFVDRNMDEVIEDEQNR